jgi:hypothetical protein
MGRCFLVSAFHGTTGSLSMNLAWGQLFKMATPHGFDCAWRVGFVTGSGPLVPRDQGIDTTSCFLLLDA